MNSFFNLKRFTSLLRKYSLENLKKNLISIGAASGILFFWFLFVALVPPRGLEVEMQEVFFVFFFLLSISIFTSGIFSVLGDKRKAVAFLTLPASHFEKLLVGWLYSFVVFPVIFTIIFYAVLTVCIQIGSAADPSKNTEIINLLTSPFIIAFGIPVYILLHGISFLSALSFNKHHFIKAAISSFAALILLTLLNGWILGLFIDVDMLFAFPFFNVSFKEGSNFFTLNLNENQFLFLLISFTLLAILFWLSAYFKLKEKQV